MDEDAFNARLDASPDDWDTRLIYADFLEEQGRDEEAAGQRWQVAFERHPSDRDRWRRDCWTWHCAIDLWPEDPFRIPNDVMANLEHADVALDEGEEWSPGKAGDRWIYTYYHNRRDAELALSRALALTGGSPR